ncbi:glycosyltransferase family 4 protein [Brachybacterium phenoliresistens]|uniref:glycosyltransferase family 4 protein n=1 Tax=Brachybacterium phenoliresistens TaxID=396014 RepID=UPI0031D74547
MRILLVTHYYAPEYGAPQRRWSALVRRFVRAGHQVTVVAPVPHYPEGRPTRAHGREHRPGTVERGTWGEQILRTGYLPHRADILTRTADHMVAALDALRRASARFRRPGTRPDVIIATAPAIPSLLVGRVLAARWKVPLIAEMRDAWPDLVTHIGPVVAGEDVEPRRATPARRVASVLAGFAKQQVHHVVSDWQEGADRVVTTTALFADVLRARGIEKVDVVRNGTDLSRLGPAVRRPRSDHEELRVLYLGNMGRSQGLEMVVIAAARLAREGVPIQVRMIGHGVASADLAELAQRLDAPVTVGTRIPHREVGEQYDWADTVLVSLRDWEPFAWTIPSKLYELLATGRHVSAVVAGESADVVRAAGAGDVIRPGDLDGLAELWRRLAADRSGLSTGGAGRDWVALHADDDLLAEVYLEILAETVGDRAAPGGSAGPGVRAS